MNAPSSFSFCILLNIRILYLSLYNFLRDGSPSDPLEYSQHRILCKELFVSDSHSKYVIEVCPMLAGLSYCTSLDTPLVYMRILIWCALQSFLLSNLDAHTFRLDTWNEFDRKLTATRNVSSKSQAECQSNQTWNTFQVQMLLEMLLAWFFWMFLLCCWKTSNFQIVEAQAGLRELLRISST